MKKHEIWELLKKKFPEKEYALMEEVSDAAGFNRSRSADYISVNLWPSRGLAINGIELKSFRGDWLNELKNPKKAENIFKYCDFFWLLTTDSTVAKIEEIPINWGWMCINGSRIKILKEAPKLTPVTISRDFLCSMLKRAQDKTEYVRISSIEVKIQERVDHSMKAQDYQIQQLTKKLDDLNKTISDFRDASGVDLSNYRHNHWNITPAKVGQYLKLMENGGHEALKQQILDLKNKSEEINRKIIDATKIFENQ